MLCVFVNSQASWGSMRWFCGYQAHEMTSPCTFVTSCMLYKVLRWLHFFFFFFFFSPQRAVLILGLDHSDCYGQECTFFMGWNDLIGMSIPHIDLICERSGNKSTIALNASGADYDKSMTEIGGPSACLT